MPLVVREPRQWLARFRTSAPPSFRRSQYRKYHRPYLWTMVPFCFLTVLLFLGLKDRGGLKPG